MIVNTLYCGDADKLVDSLSVNSVDLVFTSPPYAGKREKVYTVEDYDNYVEWLFGLSKKFMRVLKPNGSFVLNIKEGIRNGKKETYVLEYVLKMAKEGWWNDTYVWSKTNPYPIGSKSRLKDGFEYCFHFTKGKHKFFPKNCLVKANEKWLKDNLKRKNKGEHNVTNRSGLDMSVRTVSEWARPSNVLSLPTNTTNIDHPAVFPVDLPRFFIKLMTEANDIVLDPFVGSGSTAIAAIEEGRQYIGFDNKVEYIELAAERIQKNKEKK